jgi:hypothetical protein
VARSFGVQHVKAARVGSLLLLSALGTGCGRSGIEARIGSAHGEEAAIETLHDYEIGQAALAARLGALEALYVESGGDQRVAVLLARAWSRYSFEFIVDAAEQALESADSSGATYHLLRARAGFERAFSYADGVLELRAKGFSSALVSESSLKVFVETKLRDPSAAEALLWAGFARIGYADTAADPRLAARARVAGLVLLRRSLAVNPELASGAAHLGLALGLSKGAAPDFAGAARELAEAERASKGTRLFVAVVRARRIACARRDASSFERELDRVLGASDPSPSLRLENAAAKRRARRYLTSPVVSRECFVAARE